jgi:hypothetical protein
MAAYQRKGHQSGLFEEKLYLKMARQWLLAFSKAGSSVSAARNLHPKAHRRAFYGPCMTLPSAHASCYGAAVCLQPEERRTSNRSIKPGSPSEDQEGVHGRL